MSQNFIEKALKVHGNIYEYSKTFLLKSNQKVKIVCKKHGEFEHSKFTSCSNLFANSLCKEPDNGCIYTECPVQQFSENE